MAAACALAIISGIGFLFGIQKSLRAFLNPLFTGRVAAGSSICRACFLRKRRRYGKRTLSVIAARCHLPRRGRFCSTYRQMPKSSPFRGSWQSRQALTERVGSPLRESRKSRQVLTERGAQEKLSAVVTSVISVQ